MKVSVLGPSNLDKFSELTGLTEEQIEQKAKAVGTAIAKAGHQLTVVYAYVGMIELVGQAYKAAGGRLTMVAPSDDPQWDIRMYEHHLSEADEVVRVDGWSDIWLYLVSEPDMTICCGLSAGVLGELAYMKFNLQEDRGTTRRLIGVEDLLRDGKIPPELSIELEPILEYVESHDLFSVLQNAK